VVDDSFFQRLFDGRQSAAKSEQETTADGDQQESTSMAVFTRPIIAISPEEVFGDRPLAAAPTAELPGVGDVDRCPSPVVSTNSTADVTADVTGTAATSTATSTNDHLSVAIAESALPQFVPRARRHNPQSGGTVGLTASSTRRVSVVEPARRVFPLPHEDEDETEKETEIVTAATTMMTTSTCQKLQQLLSDETEREKKENSVVDDDDDDDEADKTARRRRRVGGSGQHPHSRRPFRIATALSTATSQQQ
jgi:hypothetical protein